MANQVPHAPNFLSFWLQVRLLVICIALGTYQMRGLAVLHSGLYAISQRSLPSVYQFIAFLLSRPIFQAHNLLFKIVYAAQVRRMNIVRLGQCALRIEKMPLNVDDRLIFFSFGFQRINALRDLERSLHAVVAAFDRLNHPRRPS